MTWYVDEDTKSAYLISRDGTNRRPILRDIEGSIRGIGWLPDGTGIGMIVSDDEYPDGAIWTAAADGTGAEVFYDGRDAGCDSVFHPSWSPDMSKMSLVCYVGTDTSVAILDLETRELSHIANYVWPEWLDNSADWTADSQRLAYDVQMWDPTDKFLIGSRLATIAADGSTEPTYLSEFDTFYSRPSWGPNDERLAFNSYDLGNMRGEISDMYTMAPDGSDVQVLLLASEVGVERIAHAVWDPDGTRIWVAVVDDNESSFHPGWIDPETRELTVLTVDGAGVSPRPLPSGSP